MKIGIDCRMLGLEHGGIGRYVLELVNNILEIDKENEFYLFYNQESENEILKIKSKIQKLKALKVNIRHYSVMEQLKFGRILNQYNLDLVHFPNFNFPILYKKPFVITIHDMVHHKISGAKKTNYLHFLGYKKIINQAGKKARAIITVSQASKKDIVKYLNVLPRKVEVIYEAPALEFIDDPGETKKVKDRYFLQRPYFLFVGVLERKKNLISLTRGFDEFLKNYNFDMDLVIAGKTDSHYPEVKYKAMDIKNKNRLVFTGQVEDSELAVLYKNAYAFVSASLHEGFGLPGVEAMSFGLPLAVSNSPVFNEIYDNAAIYFNPTDVKDIAAKMELLVKDKQFYENLSQKSLIRSENYSWQKTAEQTLEVYKQIIQKV